MMGVTGPCPARALAAGVGSSAPTRSRTTEVASRPTTWACTRATAVSVSAAPVATWRSCHWAQRLQASAGCYCGRRTTTVRRHRCRAAVAAWAAGLVSCCSRAGRWAGTEACLRVGGTSLYGPLPGLVGWLGMLGEVSSRNARPIVARVGTLIRRC